MEPALPFPAPAPRRSALGPKVALGCGLLLVIFLGTCGGFTWIAKRQAEAAAHQGWAQLRAPFERLATDAGAAALYRESPALAARFGSEAEFLAAAAAWRPRLEALPAQRPALRELLGKDGSRFRIRKDAVKGRPRLWIRYAPQGGATFTVELEDGRVVDLDAR
jgi:hypothetical protein